MTKNVILIVTLLLFAFAVKASGDKIKYRQGKKLDFEALLIEGENKRPEFSVVTGNEGEKDLGLLRLRENFNDLMAQDAGETIQ